MVLGFIQRMLYKAPVPLSPAFGNSGGGNQGEKAVFKTAVAARIDSRGRGKKGEEN